MGDFPFIAEVYRFGIGVRHTIYGKLFSGSGPKFANKDYF